MNPVCPYCGNEILPGDCFCIHCGKPVIRPEQPPMPPVSPEEGEQPWQCSRCGGPNRQEDIFCIHCGQRREAPVAPPQPVTAPQPPMTEAAPEPPAVKAASARPAPEAPAAPMPPMAEEERKKPEKRGRGGLILALVLVFLLLLTGGALYFLGVFDGWLDQSGQPIPTAMAMETPGSDPLEEPTAMPPEVSTAVPTAAPTAAPTLVPTQAPTATPRPTAVPTAAPTAAPTLAPTQAPTATPRPTAVPTHRPTAVPTAEPAFAPALKAPAYFRGASAAKACPIYSGPGTQYFQGANGKASISFTAGFNIWGEVNGWLLVSYDVTAGVDQGTTRMGYVKLSEVPANVKKAMKYASMQFSDQAARVTGKVDIRDSENTRKTPMATLSAGDQVIYLASYGELDYVECTSGGKKMRGFIPSGYLIPLK